MNDPAELTDLGRSCVRTEVSGVPADRPAAS